MLDDPIQYSFFLHVILDLGIYFELYNPWCVEREKMSIPVSFSVSPNFEYKNTHISMIVNQNKHC